MTEPTDAMKEFERLASRVALDVGSIILAEPPMRPSKAIAAIIRIIDELKQAHARAASQMAVQELRTVQETIAATQNTIDDVDNIIEEHIEKLQEGKNA